MNDRKNHIDFAAGVMLSWMILGHTISHANYSTTILSLGKYLSFFMPWFFYKAGMFYQPLPLSKTKYYAKKLLLPFVIYSSIGQLFYYLCLFVENNISFRSCIYQPLRSLFVAECLPGNGALWFLIVLFIIYTLVPYILRYFNPIILVISGIAISFICFVLDISWFPRLLPNVAGGLTFFVIGYSMKDYEYKWWIILIAIVGYLLCCIIGYPSIYFHHNTADNELTYLLYYPASVFGIILLNNLCRYISPYIKYSLFRWIGKHAMNLYVTHWIILIILRLTILDLLKLENSNMIFCSYLIIMLISLPLLNFVINKIKQHHIS